MSVKPQGGVWLVRSVINPTPPDLKQVLHIMKKQLLRNANTAKHIIHFHGAFGIKKRLFAVNKIVYLIQCLTLTYLF